MVAAHYTITGTHLPSGKKITFLRRHVVPLGRRQSRRKLVDVRHVRHDATDDGCAGVDTRGDMDRDGAVADGEFHDGCMRCIRWTAAAPAMAACSGRVNPDPTTFGMFPDLTGGANFWATESVRVAPNTYKTGMVTYGTKSGEGLIEQVGSIGGGGLHLDGHRAGYERRNGNSGDLSG